MKEIVEVEMKFVYVIITNTQNMVNLLSNVRVFCNLSSGCVSLSSPNETLSVADVDI